ncbi:MAG TPA: F0F1 ATP synthase subunit gamma [Desulfomicrobiaceae bacterium]|nr:F0F1 ATP synthase subunit gamma [Desulfomicrobiaceae bacterium]
MQTQETLKRKLKSAEELYSVVRTMKALAAVSIRQYENAVESLKDYSLTVELGLRAIMRRNRYALPAVKKQPGHSSVALILFGSDQGMCGKFNEDIIVTARDLIADFASRDMDTSVMTVGERVSPAFESSLYHKIPLPGQVEGITPRVQEMVTALDLWQREKNLRQIFLIHNSPVSGGTAPNTEQLLPLDREWFKQLDQTAWPSRAIPQFPVDQSELFSALIRQYLFVSLYQAMAESLAGENAARLNAMQAAEKNIEELIGSLTQDFHQQRQNSITEELLDIIAGFETMQKKI